jgi:hypothetical protein
MMFLTPVIRFWPKISAEKHQGEQEHCHDGETSRHCSISKNVSGALLRTDAAERLFRNVELQLVSVERTHDVQFHSCRKHCPQRLERK